MLSSFIFRRLVKGTTLCPVRVDSQSATSIARPLFFMSQRTLKRATDYNHYVESFHCIIYGVEICFLKIPQCPERKPAEYL